MIPTVSAMADPRTGVYFDSSRYAYTFLLYEPGNEKPARLGQCSAELPDDARDVWSRRIASQLWSIVLSRPSHD